jgi:alpha-amylase/alpha-mannosidase (GH57 family)
MNGYVCIHGHFYQPPRENPWLEEIEVQDSAHPFHDWNERLTAECYAPNSFARILDGEGRIVRLVNNYARISFNFGPTLLNWLEHMAADVYRAVLDADRESRERFSGHGSALAQAYNHVILPLASRADKVTQVLWGLRDFEYRFRRRPEGMWLPETAVDLETWPSTASGSRSCRPTRRTASAVSARRPGRTSPAGASIPPSPMCSAYPRGDPSTCSSTTAWSRGPSPSSGCWPRANTWPGG